MRSFIISLALFGVSLAACTDNKPATASTETPTAAVQDDQGASDGISYTVDIQTSIVRWKGTEPVGDGHYGSLRLKSGSLRLDESGRLLGGEFVLDMVGIEVEDLNGSKKTKLESHLKDGDFFETNKYPEARFRITGATPADPNGAVQIEGDLTMRDATHPVRFPAMLRLDGARLEAETSEFEIDRTKWGVTYRSGLIGTLKDNLIDDAIKLQIRLQASKQ